MTKLLLTGSTGFVGRYILEELELDKYDHLGIDEIVLFVRSVEKAKDLESSKYSYSIFNGDLLDHESIRDAVKGCDYVIHTASLYDASSSRELFEKINVEATRVLMSSVSKNTKVVLTSTYGVYGFPNVEQEITEDFEDPEPFWHYQETKAEQEKLAFDIAEERGIKLIAIRPPLIFGPGDYFFIPNIIKNLKAGQFFYLRKNGENITPCAHPADVAKAHGLALLNIDEYSGEAYHLKSFDATFKELIESFKDKLGITKKTRRVPYFLAYFIGWLGEILPIDTDYSRFSVKFLGSHSLLNQSKIKNDLGFEPSYGFEETMEESISWYKEENPSSRT